MKGLLILIFLSTIVVSCQKKEDRELVFTEEVEQCAEGRKISYNGFYASDQYDSTAEYSIEYFLAINGGEARILQHDCQGYSIAEGTVVIDGSYLYVETENYSYVFEIRGEEDYYLTLVREDQSGQLPCKPQPGADFYLLDYYLFIYHSSDSWSDWLHLENQPQGWGKWFGDYSTLVVNIIDWA